MTITYTNQHESFDAYEHLRILNKICIEIIDGNTCGVILSDGKAIGEWVVL